MQYVHQDQNQINKPPFKIIQGWCYSSSLRLATTSHPCCRVSRFQLNCGCSSDRPRVQISMLPLNLGDWMATPKETARVRAQFKSLNLRRKTHFSIGNEPEQEDSVWIQ